MSEVVVLAMGADRPGIVAEFTSAIASQGASIADSAMSHLGGQFAIMVTVSGTEADALQEGLQPTASQLGLVLMVTGAVAHEHEAGEQYTLTAYGPDRPGLVASLAGVLAKHKINIEDFGSRTNHGASAPTNGDLFFMHFSLEVPNFVNVYALNDEIVAAAGEHDLDVTFELADTDAL